MAFEKRAAINSPAASMLFARNFIENVKLPKNSIVALYAANKNELDVSFLAAVLADAGHSVCLPRIGSQPQEMNFHEYKIGDELQANKFGILEPLANAKHLEPNVVIVPMLAFDRNKNRLGYGGGYYDKYLQNSKALRVGATYAALEIPEIPSESHDIRMNIIVTDDFVL